MPDLIDGSICSVTIAASLFEIRAMLSTFHSCFAEVDANLLALGALIVVAFLVWEVLRERRKRRRRNSDRKARERSRKGHWGYT